MGRLLRHTFACTALVFACTDTVAHAEPSEERPRKFAIDVKSASAVLRSDRPVPVSTLGVTLSAPLAGSWLRGGLSYAVASAGNPSFSNAKVRGAYALSGNASAWTRAMWEANGLYAAGFLELWLPTAAYDPRGPAASAADAAQTTTLSEPWRFTPAAFGGSLGVEIGFHRGPLMAAVHQTLDAAVIVMGESRQSGIATTLLVLDFVLSRDLLLGGRVLQRYDLDPSIAADSRRRLQLGPAVNIGHGRTTFESMVLFGESAAHPASSSAILRLALRHTW